MGITTPLSTNPAMTIGGLNVGVTPLDMAHAYETIAHGGERVSGSLVSDLQPVGIQEVSAGNKLLSDGHHHDLNTVIAKRVLPAEVASTETSVLETVLEYGTAKDAALGQFAAGKTGTTSNYGDAWFVGWDSKYTVAVWVGYPNSLVPMTTDFDGGPVLGGHLPRAHLAQLHDLRDAGRTGTRAARRLLQPHKAGFHGHRARIDSRAAKAPPPPPPAGGATHAGGTGEAQGATPNTHANGTGANERTGAAPRVEQTPAGANPTPATPAPETPRRPPLPRQSLRQKPPLAPNPAARAPPAA